MPEAFISTQHDTGLIPIRAAGGRGRAVIGRASPVVPTLGVEVGF